MCRLIVMPKTIEALMQRYASKIRHTLLSAMPSSRERRARVPDHFEFLLATSSSTAASPVAASGTPASDLQDLWKRMQDEVSQLDRQEGKDRR